MRYSQRLGIAASLFCFISFPSQSCTDFRLTAKDGTLLITRSMEFAPDLQSNLRTSTRGRVTSTQTSNNLPGLSWTAKYGYVYVDGFNMDAAFDGMNEAGLTFEYLYLPGETQYQTIPAGKDNQALPYYLFGNWVLANFKTIEEVKQALNEVYISSVIIPQLGDAVLPAHASIYDASGKGIVVEFYDNKANVSDSIGIMTNSPKYSWHITNLRNYLNLSPYNSASITKNGMTYNSVGQGSGSVGLPGDASPPSRFVKMSFMLKYINQPENADALLNMAEHIINNVDLPSGYVRAQDNGQTVTDITQWVVFKDITHKMFYYRTYADLSLRAIAFDKLDFSEKGPLLKMPLVDTPKIRDVTSTLLGSK